jgi:hypoxanthine phosphoribosyltransferase
LEKELLFSEKTIQGRVAALAERICSDYEGEGPLFIGILNGVIFFFADLMRAISLPVTMDFLRATSYGSRMDSSGVVRITKDVEVPIEGRHLILVEDIVDTGLTLSHITRKMQAERPQSLRICALIDKTERRQEKITIDYCGFQVQTGFIVGYGLDYKDKYRNLRDIYVIKGEKSRGGER